MRDLHVLARRRQREAGQHLAGDAVDLEDFARGRVRDPGGRITQVDLIGSAVANTKYQTRDQGDHYADHDSLGPGGGHARFVHTPSRLLRETLARLSSQHEGWFFG